MIVIPIDSDTRLVSGKKGWTVQKRGKLKGKNIWKSGNWWPLPGSAVRHLSRQLVRDCNAQSLDEAIREVEKIGDKLSRALTPKISFEDVG